MGLTLTRFIDAFLLKTASVWLVMQTYSSQNLPSRSFDGLTGVVKLLICVSKCAWSCTGLSLQDRIHGPAIVSNQ
jgi:hypothetical protein